MENNVNGTKNAMEKHLNGRLPQWNMTSMEDDLNIRRPQWKATSTQRRSSYSKLEQESYKLWLYQKNRAGKLKLWQPKSIWKEKK